MIPHASLVGLVLSAAALGACLASLAWHAALCRERAHSLQFARAVVAEMLATARQKDAAYRRGYCDGERNQELRTRFPNRPAPSYLEIVR